MPKTHKAAILPEKQSRLAVVERDTPEPGPDEILLEIKCVALNPVDQYQRDFGFPPVAQYPTIVGSDAAGIVAKVGSNVSTVAPGTRVMALASGFFQNNNPDYGSFQEYALVGFETVVPIPEAMSFEEASSFPLTFGTAATSFTSIGIPLDTRHTPEDKQAILIWGASSSVGTFSIQVAKILGFTVYATASAKNHEYLKKLVADALFDYKDSDVVAQIVAAVKKDGSTLVTAHGVVNDSMQPCLDVLKETKGDKAAKLTFSPPLPKELPTLDNTEIKWNFPDMANMKTHYQKVYHELLQNGLKNGSIVPSPPVQVEAGGLEGINAAMDKLTAGVSLTKIVVPL
ncbi:GroES-like protein [Xylariaceae sp. FL0255]|nr:GroES-like protein [Xylariaceae sp. FL0255]